MTTTTENDAKAAETDKMSTNGDMQDALQKFAAAIDKVEARLAARVDAGDRSFSDEDDAAIRRQAALARRCADEAATRLDAAIKDLGALIETSRKAAGEKPGGVNGAS